MIRSLFKDCASDFLTSIEVLKEIVNVLVLCERSRNILLLLEQLFTILVVQALKALHCIVSAIDLI